jgi:hypothetical protein
MVQRREIQLVGSQAFQHPVEWPAAAVGSPQGDLVRGTLHLPRELSNGGVTLCC